MNESTQGGTERGYPFRMSRVYVNAATTILAVFLAIVILPEPLLLLLFLLLTISIGAALFVLKIRPIFKVSKPRDQQGSLTQPLGRRALYVLLILVIAIIALPFLLFLSAAALPTYTWFSVLASLASGIGISEILYYVYCRRNA